MAKLRAICPHCDATFNVKDRSAVGKRVKCPSCGDPFRIKADRPADDVDDLFDEDEYDDFEDDFDDDDEFFEDDRRRPAASTRGSRGTKKKSKKGSKGKKKADKTGGMLVVGIAAVLLVGVLAVGGYFISRMFGGSGGGLDTSYLPPDSDVVVQVRIRDLANSELLGDQFDAAEAAMGGGGGFAGFGGARQVTPRDIRRMSVGVSGLTDLDPQQMQNPFFAMQAMQNLEWLVVLETSKSITEDPTALGYQKRDHTGEEYWMMPDGAAIWYAQSRVTVVGSEKAIKAAMDRGKGNSSLEQYSFVDGSRDIVLAMRPTASGLEKLRRQDQQSLDQVPGLPESVKSMAKNLREGCVGVAFCIDVDSDVDVVVQCEIDGEDRAGTVESDIGKVVDLGRTTLNEFGGQMPADVADLAKAILDDVEVSRDGTTVSVAMQIPGDLQNRLRNFDPTDLGRLVAGAAGGGGGAFGPGAGGMHDHGDDHGQPVVGGGNPGGGPPRIGEASGNTVAAPKVVIEVKGYDGDAPPAIEARQVISRNARSWADALRFAYDGDAGEIHVGVKRGANPETNSVKAALEGAGFQVGAITEPAAVAGGAGGGGHVPDPLPAAAAGLRAADQNNLKQIGLAIHEYHDTHGELPTDVFAADGRTRLLSWRVRLLPFLEQQELYEQFNLEEAWDGPTNGPLAARMPAVFRSPARSELIQPANLVKTTYVGFTNGTMLGDQPPLRFRDVTDGLSNTIAVVEGGGAGHFVEWTKPGDSHSVHSIHMVARIDWNKQYPGFNALFGDGKVRFYTRGMDSGDLKKMLIRNDGEVVNVENGSVKLAPR